MPEITISSAIKKELPDFKIGVVLYHNIAVSESPQMLKGRTRFYQENLKIDLEKVSFNTINEIKETRDLFKRLGVDPSKYRPSSEALFRRIKKGNNIPSVHSAADLNNLFSLQYRIPVGIYDLDKIVGPVTIRMGEENEVYDAINGRSTNLKGKLISADQNGPFGSPIVDSRQTAVTEQTKNALQIFYLTPSLKEADGVKLIQSAASMFHQIHGGENKTLLIT
ncbi:B3/B4 domain-containing protein [Pseudalkalibacillus caeni]|uniref:B3/B4 tRNA-binding domain-containing protein n=1 Tax=Exobacillus caeni TaxID=2574798 RepID=A0A5R9FAU0_9BACL|nr:phenylalanine--tRNA ligase beta subunit-related protein [Pseudalkalibacillus caeni]TLS37993.1 hypothetical protein FCL54_05450 [Pseudalkalibacillus caeni]